MKFFKKYITSILIIVFHFSSCNEKSQIEDPGFFTLEEYSSFAEGILFFIEADSDGGKSGQISMNLVRDAYGDAQIAFVSADEFNILKPTIENFLAPPCKDSAGGTWDKCKKFTGGLKSLKIGNWLNDNFGDCSCLETRSEKDDSGDITVYAQCC